MLDEDWWLKPIDFDLDIQSQHEEEKETTMKKHWKLAFGLNATQYETYEAAVDAAKRKSKDYDSIGVYEAVANVVTPVPPAEVVKL